MTEPQKVTMADVRKWAADAAALIAAARTAVPALCAEIERLNVVVRACAEGFLEDKTPRSQAAALACLSLLTPEGCDVDATETAG